jgi:hypothetical protein
VRRPWRCLSLVVLGRRWWRADSDAHIGYAFSSVSTDSRNLAPSLLSRPQAEDVARRNARATQEGSSAWWKLAAEWELACSVGEGIFLLGRRMRPLRTMRGRLTCRSAEALLRSLSHEVGHLPRAVNEEKASEALPSRPFPGRNREICCGERQRWR